MEDIKPALAPIYVAVCSSGAHYIGVSSSGPQGTMITLQRPLQYMEAAQKSSGNQVRITYALNPPMRLLHADAVSVRWEALIGPEDMNMDSRQRLQQMHDDAWQRLVMSRSGLIKADGAAVPPEDVRKATNELLNKLGRK